MFPTEPAPETIGAYKILRRLAGSGSTSVYLGRLDGPLGFRRVCELKLVPNTAEGDPRFADELAREASICASLNHPVIVRMFDFFEHGGKLALVLEHVEGVNLNRLLQHLATRQQKLADAAVYYLVQCIASALAHAHGATDEHGSPTPVIHRNLHPENIVIGWDGQVRLTGFGIGKILGRTPDTIAGVVKGAPGYMAPEQVRAERVTVKADIYGVGLLLWSLLTGRRPAADGTRPVAITTIRPEIPRPIVALLDTALAPAPDDRKLSCQEIEQTLAKVARPEKGKAELVTRVQSAHATIELEDADPEEDRRPTIPVKGKGGQTSRPAADAARRLAKDLFAKDARGEKPKPGIAQADTARPPAAAAAAAVAGGPRKDGPPGARAAEPITIPAPAVEPPPLPSDRKGGAGKPPEVRKPALPDRETFGRLYEASKRAAERDAAAAEEEAAGGMPTLPGDEPSFDEEDDDATLPGSGTASSRFGISIAPIPEAIRFGPPPALPADLAPVFFGPPPPKPPSGAPLTPSGVAVPLGASGLTPPGGMPAVAGSGLTPPGVTVPVPVGSPGLVPPGGGPHGGRAGLTGGASSEPPLSAGPSSRRRRGPAQLWQAPRSLPSMIGTVAVSAITATVVAVLWIYVARRERPVVAVTAQVEETPAVEPVISAAPVPAPAPATAAKRGAGARTPAKASAAASASAAAAAASASAAAAAASASAAAAAASASAAAAAASASAAAAAASASAAAAAPPPASRTPAASPARAEPSVASLAKGQGLLTVGYPDAGGVYVNGKFVGPVNEALVVRCGRYFVRVGKAGNTKFPEWLSAGVTAQVPCQGAARIDIKPPAPPKKRAR
ncbi:protein kinase [Sorangium cellulosum]|uniref:Protein kinase n=1 Tax=Sorangium cellulosum TaxID=56 RepID=A0A2L0FAV4_SORCE|nr:serine/threonine-protein kinase [Sorangium cellulosum]AUX48569.1 protein kinase [Sorangium cellulosum]